MRLTIIIRSTIQGLACYVPGRPCLPPAWPAGQPLFPLVSWPGCPGGSPCGSGEGKEKLTPACWGMSLASNI